jgi:hypothetical protein
VVSRKKQGDVRLDALNMQQPHLRGLSQHNLNNYNALYTLTRQAFLAMNSEAAAAADIRANCCCDQMLHSQQKEEKYQ